jgi:hypothetical protein
MNRNILRKSAQQKRRAWSMDNTKAELLAAADSLGVEVDARDNKPEILAAIKAA